MFQDSVAGIRRDTMKKSLPVEERAFVSGA